MGFLRKIWKLSFHAYFGGRLFLMNIEGENTFSLQHHYPQQNFRVPYILLVIFWLLPKHSWFELMENMFLFWKWNRLRSLRFQYLILFSIFLKIQRRIIYLEASNTLSKCKTIALRKDQGDKFKIVLCKRPKKRQQKNFERKTMAKNYYKHSYSDL